MIKVVSRIKWTGITLVGLHACQPLMPLPFFDFFPFPPLPLFMPFIRPFADFGPSDCRCFSAHLKYRVNAEVVAVEGWYRKGVGESGTCRGSCGIVVVDVGPAIELGLVRFESIVGQSGCWCCGDDVVATVGRFVGGLAGGGKGTGTWLSTVAVGVGVGSDESVRVVVGDVVDETMDDGKFVPVVADVGVFVGWMVVADVGVLVGWMVVADVGVFVGWREVFADVGVFVGWPIV
jgi:hypothetical protein